MRNEGYFRHIVQPPRTKGWRRTGDLRWSPQVHKVVSINGPMVTDEEGRQYAIKEVLPVPEGSTELQLAGRGLSIAGQVKQDALKSQRSELENYLEGEGGQATVRKRITDLRLEVPASSRSLLARVSPA